MTVTSGAAWWSEVEAARAAPGIARAAELRGIVAQGVRNDMAVIEAEEVTSRRAAAAAVSIARHAELVAGRDESAAAAQVSLDASAGKADEGLRAALESAIAALRATGAGPDGVHAAQSATSDLSAQVDVSTSVWEADQAAKADAKAAAQAKAAAKAATKPKQAAAQPATTDAAVDPEPAPAAAASSSLEDFAEQTLRSLPSNGGITLKWNDPDLHGHLGAVWVGGGSYIMLNGPKLAGNQSKTRDVIRHEIAHVYQTRVTANAGISVADLRSRLTGVFGGNGLETSADCVAREFGASWTFYTKSCGGDEKHAWVSALIDGRLP